MKCMKCGHDQDTGNFCGKCGIRFEESFKDPIETPVPPVVEQAATLPQQPVQPIEPNVHVEKVKVKSKVYFSYFMQYLKSPSLAYNRGEAEFSNSLISIILLVTIIGLSLHTFVSKMFGGLIDGYGPGFFSLFGGVFIFTAVAIGIVLLSLFLINKFFGPQLSLNAIVSLYGAHLSPILILAAASLLLMMLRSFTYGNFTLSIVFMFIIFILPLYLISLLLTKNSTAVDPLYSYIFYIALFSILFIIFVTILADSSLGGYIDELTYFF